MTNIAGILVWTLTMTTGVSAGVASAATANDAKRAGVQLEFKGDLVDFLVPYATGKLYQVADIITAINNGEQSSLDQARIDNAYGARARALSEYNRVKNFLAIERASPSYFHFLAALRIAREPTRYSHSDRFVGGAVRDSYLGDVYTAVKKGPELREQYERIAGNAARLNRLLRAMGIDVEAELDGYIKSTDWYRDWIAKHEGAADGGEEIEVLGNWRRKGGLLFHKNDSLGYMRIPLSEWGFVWDGHDRTGFDADLFFLKINRLVERWERGHYDFASASDMQALLPLIFRYLKGELDFGEASPFPEVARHLRGIARDLGRNYAGRDRWHPAVDPALDIELSAENHYAAARRIVLRSPVSRLVKIELEPPPLYVDPNESPGAIRSLLAVGISSRQGVGTIVDRGGHQSLSGTSTYRREKLSDREPFRSAAIAENWSTEIPFTNFGVDSSGKVFPEVLYLDIVPMARTINPDNATEVDLYVAWYTSFVQRPNVVGGKHAFIDVPFDSRFWRSANEIGPYSVVSVFKSVDGGAYNAVASRLHPSNREFSSERTDSGLLRLTYRDLFVAPGKRYDYRVQLDWDPAKIPLAEAE